MQIIVLYHLWFIVSYLVPCNSQCASVLLYFTFSCPIIKWHRGIKCLLCHSVPSNLSSQLLLHPCLDLNQTWYRCFFHKSRCTCGEIIHVPQILLKLLPCSDCCNMGHQSLYPHVHFVPTGSGPAAIIPNFTTNSGRIVRRRKLSIYSNVAGTACLGLQTWHSSGCIIIVHLWWAHKVFILVSSATVRKNV